MPFNAAHCDPAQRTDSTHIIRARTKQLRNMRRASGLFRVCRRHRCLPSCAHMMCGDIVQHRGREVGPAEPHIIISWWAQTSVCVLDYADVRSVRVSSDGCKWMVRCEALRSAARGEVRVCIASHQSRDVRPKQFHYTTYVRLARCPELPLVMRCDENTCPRRDAARTPFHIAFTSSILIVYILRYESLALRAIAFVRTGGVDNTNQKPDQSAAVLYIYIWFGAVNICSSTIIQSIPIYSYKEYTFYRATTNGICTI